MIINYFNLTRVCIVQVFSATLRMLDDQKIWNHF